ncbi:MAG TPA: ArsR family transcriptional regulator [Polyangiaceae bacterium]
MSRPGVSQHLRILLDAGLVWTLMLEKLAEVLATR